MLERILEEIGRHDRFLICSHDAPDGDAVGSELGLAAVLASMGKTSTIINPSPIPENLRFLPGADRILAYPQGMDAQFDAFVSVDAGRRDRVHPVDEVATTGVPFLNIDHHDGNDDFGTVNWCDARYGSTGEMIYDLARRAGVDIDLDLALPLYVALVTDTGRFSYGNTTPSAHRMAEALLEVGIAPDDVHRRIYREKTVGRIRLEASAMTHLRTTLEGRIAWCAVDAEALASAGIDAGEARDLIGVPASLRGVELALSFRELAAGAGTKISLRSFGPFRVNDFAARYGGGGHRVAAGLRLEATLEEAQERIIRDLEAALVELDASLAGEGAPR